MNDFQITTPVAFLVFNRPDTAQRVFDEIRKARPPKLLVVADGPRADRPEETALCESVRAIIDGVDWPCEVLKNYADENLGCKRRISSGLDWVFEQVEEAIILEDDCLPHPSFFPFCEKLLQQYRSDTRVMQIGGCNFQNGIQRGEGSYYFSKYNHIWGWASWKRAWSKYDLSMKNFPLFVKQNQIKNIWSDTGIQKYWIQIFQNVYNDKINTWDYQWTFSVWCENGLTVLPNVNLVSNIGFDDRAAHTGKKNRAANIKVGDLSDIKHPTFVIIDEEADNYTFKSHFYYSLISRIIISANRRIKQNLKALKKFFNHR